MALTAPVLVPVVTAANSAAAPAPKRTSLPSMLPSAWSTPAGKSGLPPASPAIATTAPDDEHAGHRREDRPALALVAAPCGRTCRSAPNGMTRMANISSQLVSGVGFSNGCAELALKKPPPLVPSSLIDLLRGDGPERDRLLGALERRHACGRPSKRLGDALPDEHEGADDGERQQDVERRAGQVDPEVADRSRSRAARGRG